MIINKLPTWARANTESFLTKGEIPDTERASYIAGDEMRGVGATMIEDLLGAIAEDNNPEIDQDPRDGVILRGDGAGGMVTAHYQLGPDGFDYCAISNDINYGNGPTGSFANYTQARSNGEIKSVAFTYDKGEIDSVGQYIDMVEPSNSYSIQTPRQ